jgi:hypothetical protein
MKPPHAAAPKPPPSVSLKPAGAPPKEEPKDESKEETVDIDKDDVAPIAPKGGDDDKTSKVPTMKPPQAAAPKAPPAPPKADAPKEEKAPAAAAEAKPEGGAKEEAKDDGAKKSKTIKLKPLDISEDDDVEETLSMDRSALMDGAVPSIAGASDKKKEEPKGEGEKKAGVEDEATIKIEKPTPKKPAHPTPSVPGSKETIKLRPSGATPPPASPGGAKKPAAASTIKVTPPPAAAPAASGGGDVSKRTIKLVPKKDGGGTSSTQSAKPSSPTVKLDESGEDVTQKVKAPSAQTVKLPDASGEGSPSKKTLKLKPKGGPATPPPGGAPAMDGAPPAAAPSKSSELEEEVVDDKSAEPGIVLTLVACAVFFLLVYLGLLIGGQWAHNEIDKDFDYQFIFMKDVVKKPM